MKVLGMVAATVLALTLAGQSFAEDVDSNHDCKERGGQMDNNGHCMKGGVDIGTAAPASVAAPATAGVAGVGGLSVGAVVGIAAVVAVAVAVAVGNGGGKGNTGTTGTTGTH